MTYSIRTYEAANHRIHAAVTLPAPMTPEQLNDYIEEIGRYAFRAVNALLEAGHPLRTDKYLTAPLVLVASTLGGPDEKITHVVFAEYREDPEYGDTDY